MKCFFLLSVPLSIGQATEVLAASGKIPIVKLSLRVFVRGSDKMFADCFTSLSGILSTPVAYFISVVFRRVVIYGFVT